MNILVTGATGFLGSQLAKDLVLQDYNVRAMRRVTSKMPAILKDVSNIEWVEGDVCDSYSLENAMDNIQTVFHCSAMVSLSNQKRKEMMHTNVTGTANVVNACLYKGVEKLIHVSFISALGVAKNNEFITEDTKFEYDPSQMAYAVSKHDSESEVWRGVAEGLNAIIVNPSIILGNSSGLEPFIKLIEKEKAFYVDGTNGFVDVKDVSSCMIKLMQSNIVNERFIINSENMSFKNLIDLIANAMHKKHPSITLKKWQLKLLGKIIDIFSKINNTEYGLNGNTLRSAYSHKYFSNEKILKAINHKFIPVHQSISELISQMNADRLK